MVLNYGIPTMVSFWWQSYSSEDGLQRQMLRLWWQSYSSVDPLWRQMVRFWWQSYRSVDPGTVRGRLTAGFRVFCSVRIMGRFIIEARVPKVGEGSARLPRRPTLATC